MGKREREERRYREGEKERVPHRLSFGIVFSLRNSMEKEKERRAGLIVAGLCRWPIDGRLDGRIGGDKNSVECGE